MIKMFPLLIVLFILPLAAVGLIFAAKRSRSMPRLARGLVWSGIAGAIFTALFTFMRSSVPIAPYELSRNAWYPIYGQSLLSLYVGFGLGVIVGAVVVSLFILVKALRKKDIEGS
jgi:hypothetical protein